MHLAMGLEFCAVAVMAGDDEVIPLKSHIETVAEDADLEEVYHTACHLRYVACPGRGSTCSSPAWRRGRSFWRIWGRPARTLGCGAPTEVGDRW